ncbi:phage protein NinX family protein [Pectobacterium carotovorum]|uniref:phage protein NinX family protein n=1 Tax=Pectobacterium carotovorum TaxID=554 RepID=UPI0015E83929|nr:phage protein NinX family protein [Pectobacterium carotovorum]
MKVKTSELRGDALDWATAKAEGLRLAIIDSEAMNITADGRVFHHVRFTEYWDICGPLIEKYWVDLFQEGTDDNFIWYAKTPHLMGESECGETPQIAICRAVVASLLGDEIELPEGLANGLD